MTRSIKIEGTFNSLNVEAAIKNMQVFMDWRNDNSLTKEEMDAQKRMMGSAYFDGKTLVVCDDADGDSFCDELAEQLRNMQGEGDGSSLKALIEQL